MIVSARWQLDFLKKFFNLHACLVWNEKLLMISKWKMTMVRIISSTVWHVTASLTDVCVTELMNCFQTRHWADCFSSMGSQSNNLSKQMTHFGINYMKLAIDLLGTGRRNKRHGWKLRQYPVFHFHSNLCPWFCRKCPGHQDCAQNATNAHNDKLPFGKPGCCWCYHRFAVAIIFIL